MPIKKASDAPGPLNADQIKTLLALTIDRVKDIAAALESNWTLQMICAAVGLALVYDIADLPKVICKYFGQDACTLRSAAPIFMVVVLYLFMKFGQMLTAFLEARQLQDLLLTRYLGQNADPTQFKPVRESTSFFEGYYSSASFRSWAPLTAAYFLVSLVVPSIEQGAALFLIVRAYRWGITSFLVTASAFTILIILYGGFWYSKKEHLHTTKIVFSCLVLIPTTFVIFLLTTS